MGLSKIIEMITGKDDLERVASKEDLGLLDSYLKRRPVFLPKRPRRYLDASNFTPEELLELIQEES